MKVSSSCCFLVSIADALSGNKPKTISGVLLWFAHNVKPCRRPIAIFARLEKFAMPRPVIIDTDPGIDDAVAILLALASSELDVRALVAVAGNLPLAVTANNARALVELAGRPELPVYAGCPRPLGPQRGDAGHVH